MTKKIPLTLSFFLLASALFAASGINQNKKRAEEIKQMHWKTNDKNFAERTIPEKWKNESAVIIAKSNMLSYKKEILAGYLNYDSYDHYRIMLLDNSALEKYAQFSIPGSGLFGNTRADMYAGFKIIKPDGREIEISLDDAVLEKQKVNDKGYDMYKLAIPNLQLGDIIDYYLCEEQNIGLTTKYYAFKPVIIQLNDDYPIMKQKISFEILRRCYINLKSLNGAPQFKLTEDKETERSYYALEDGDRESVKDIRWLYPYRELPTIKFKIIYASNSVAGFIPGFIGQPGVIKSSVTLSEITDLFGYIFTDQAGFELRLEMNKKYKTLTDKNKLARQAFYVARNIYRTDNAEYWLINGTDPNPDDDYLQYIVALSAYYRYKKINHEILIGIPRQISPLEDLILENELTVMLKVNTPTPFYIGRLDNNAMPGEIDIDMQGITAYTANGLFLPKAWTLKKVQIPVSPATENALNTRYDLNITDLNEGKIEAKASKAVTGVLRLYPQNMLMDFYDYQDEENSKVTPDVVKKSKKTQQKNNKLKESYLATREDNRLKRLKTLIESDFELEFDDPADLKIQQAGRFEETPAFQYSYTTTFKNVIKRAGPNYLVDIGKFIESQAEVKNDEKERKYNVYRPYAATFSVTVNLKIPEGYTVQGIEKLNSSVENATGGFTSKARIENNALIIEVIKHYKTNFEKKANWPLMVSFMEAAHSFNQQQILLEKIR